MTEENKCCICDKPNNFDEGTVSLHGKLVCKSCQKELEEFKHEEKSK